MNPLFVAPLLAVAVLTAQAAEIVSGPMLGHRDMRTAAVWFQANAAGEARIEYWPQDRPAARRKSVAVALREDKDFAARIDLTDLQPGTAYGYRLLIDARPVAAANAVFHTEKLWQQSWQKHAAPPDVSVLLGSCAYINDPAYDPPGKPGGDGMQIFDAMARQKTDWTIWLGDHLYLRETDTGSAWGIAARYRQVRSSPELQALLRSGHHLAIWDDHDYGSNNANAAYPLKGASLEVFQRYWANPSYGLPETAGIFSIAHTADIDFFLLDNRWNRDADTLKSKDKGKDKVMFGPAQLRWLKNALLNSSASFKIIVGGSPFLNEEQPFAGWHHFPEERREFLDWLELQKVNGVLFVSGDRHRTELLKLERFGTYPLLELTCSPLTAGVYSLGKEAENRRRVAGTLLNEHNFCRFDFSGALQERQLSIRTFDSNGNEKWRKAYSIQDFSNPRQTLR